MASEQNTDTKTPDPQEKQRTTIDYLFLKYVTKDVAAELTDIANFFSFLSERIIPNKLAIDVNNDLLERFEPVYLLLLDKLQLYPPTIRAQVEDLVKQNNVCDLMAIAGIFFQKSDKIRLWKWDFWHLLLDSISLGNGIKIKINSNSTIRVTRDMLYKLQIALRRLAGIVRYASSLEFVDYDGTFHDFKRNYDPDLVDRSKLMALINILRMEVNVHSISDEKNLILTKLDHIEQELKRPKVRWGVIITTFFVLSGFLADLKTLKPDVYEKSCAIVETIMSSIHNDGIVSKFPNLIWDKKQKDSKENSELKNIIETEFAIIPEKREREEDELIP